MVDEGCYKCIKYLIVFFNALFLLAGGALVGVGVWLRVDPNGVKAYVESSSDFEMIFTASYLMIGVGAVVIVISFLGCCGAMKESTCLLGLFFGFISLLFLVLLVAAIIMIISKESVQKVVDKSLDADVTTWNKASKEEKEKLTGTFLDIIQTKFSCCGNKLGRADFHSLLAPGSCKLTNYLRPCYNLVADWLSDHMLIAAGCLFGVVVLLLFGMVLSMVLCCSIRRSLRYST